MLLRVLIYFLRFLARLDKRSVLRCDEIPSLLVVELTRLGDVVAMLPALQVLRSGFSAATIHVVVDQRYVSLLRGSDIDIKTHEVRSARSFTGFLSALQLVRQIRPSLALSLSPAKRNAALVLACGASAKVGYLSFIDSHTPFLKSTPVEAFGVLPCEQGYYGGENIRHRSMKVCNAIGLCTPENTTGLKFRKSSLEATEDRLLRSGFVPARPYIVVHPFAGWEYRTWDIEKFHDVVERLLLLDRYDVLFLCTEEESGKLDRTREKFAARADVHLFVSRDIFDSAVLLSGALFFLGNDSGPLHLAAALGVKSLGLFGPADPKFTGPASAEGTFLFKKVECSPCEQRACIRPDRPCIDLISADEVFDEVVRSLSSTQLVTARADA